jgi:methylated-DNA-[protein]-cysteine S-methyltransferase
MTNPQTILAALAAIDDADTIAVLQAQLAERAAAEDLLDVAYRTIDTPVGSLLLAATPAGVVRVAYPIEGHEKALATLAKQVSPRVLYAPARLDLAAFQLDEYFARKRRHFDLPLDLQLARGFRRTVLDHLPEIGYGTTTSYSAVAAAAGNPKAFRAVASACATNPLPVLVPCHRVVRRDGSLAGYVGGLDAKHALLELEATR